MGKGGPRSAGELISLLFILLNLIFVIVIHIESTHCLEQVEGYDGLSDDLKKAADEAQCKDIFFFTQKNSLNHVTGEAVTEDGIKDLNHHAGRTALAITTISAGVYLVELVRQSLRVMNEESRDYTGRLELVVVSVISFVLSLTAWVLIMIEGNKLNEVSDGVGGTLEFSASTGYVLLLLIWLMNLFLAVRTSMLAYMADSWPTAIGSKGSFGGGASARVAEQYPVMGGEA